jgi:hypothetical protein
MSAAAAERPGVTTADVRAWARSRGVPVDRVGRIAASTVAAYNREHPDRPYRPAPAKRAVRRPPGSVVLTASQIATLNAVDALYRRDGRATIRAVLDLTGFESTSTVHAHLHALRRVGLVDWVEGRMGTLKPAVDRVDVDRGPARPPAVDGFLDDLERQMYD